MRQIPLGRGMWSLFMVREVLVKWKPTSHVPFQRDPTHCARVLALLRLPAIQWDMASLEVHGARACAGHHLSIECAFTSAYTPTSCAESHADMCALPATCTPLGLQATTSV